MTQVMNRAMSLPLSSAAESPVGQDAEDVRNRVVKYEEKIGEKMQNKTTLAGYMPASNYYLQR